MASPHTNITSVLKESRVFPPSPEFAAKALIPSVAQYENLARQGKDNPKGFWAKQAESLAWFRKWDRVLEWNEPFAQWFVGGKINASFNCLDRHLNGPRANKAAIIFARGPLRCR